MRFRARVDFVRIPGVIKLRNGEYTSLNLHIDIDETLAMRASIIKHTADIFDPDLFIVDKEPLGLRGEVKETLQMLKRARHAAGAGPARRHGRAGAAGAGVGAQERAAGAARPLRPIWVYGLPQICDPLEGIDLPKSVKRKMATPATCRARSSCRGARATPPLALERALSAGDHRRRRRRRGAVDWVLRAYEERPAALPRRCWCWGRSCARARPSSCTARSAARA
jgi:predicted glycosyltransferase